MTQIQEKKPGGGQLGRGQPLLAATLLLLGLLGLTLSPAAGASSARATAPSAPLLGVQEARAGKQALEADIWLTTGAELVAAEKLLVRGLQTEPKSAYYHYLLSQLYLRYFTLEPLRLIWLQKATDLAEQAMFLDQASEFGFLALAQILAISGKVEQGVAVLEQLRAEKVPLTWRYYFLAARLNADLGKFDLALKHTERGLKYPEAVGELFIPTLIVSLQSQYGEGAELLRQWKLWNQRFRHPALELMQGLSLTQEGDYVAAHQVYQQLLEKNPAYLEALINDATLLYQHLGQTQRAKKLYDRALQTRPKLLEVRAAIYAHLAAIALQENDLAEAEKRALASLTATELEIGSLPFLLQQYQKLPSPKASTAFVSLLGKAQHFFPDRADLYALEGDILGTQLGQYEQAIKTLKKALILSPRNGAYLTALGLNHYHLRQHDLALASFDAALQIDPDDALALYNKACVLALTQNRELALVSLTKALALKPELQAAARDDGDFQNLKPLPQFQELIKRQNSF